MVSRSVPIGCVILPIALAALAAADPPPTRPRLAVAELFEDDADALVRTLTHEHSYPGEAHAEAGDVYSGRRAIKIIPMQRQCPAVPGWAFPIRERPGPGEYRYLRFAWKADGCAGIMFQLHDDQYYNVRYTAGANKGGWPTKFVADSPPADWAVVTRDLFADFGPLTVRGMSLTAFGGRAAYFDHIYLGRTVEDLDRVDAASGEIGPGRPLGPGEFGRLWDDLGGASAARAYAAQWRLVAAADRAVPLVAEKLAARPPGPAAEAVRRWLRELDDDAFRVREAATAALAAHLDAAVSDVEAATRTSASPEVRARAARLLASRGGRPSELERSQRAVRVLEYAATPEASRVLQALARSDRAGVAAPADAALKRLAASGR